MKKRFHFSFSDGFWLVAIFATAALCSSFTINVKSAELHSYGNEALKMLQNYSFHKLNFWQKAVLSVGAFGASTYAVRRFRRRHGGSLGCLGVLGAIVLGVIIIALLPILLIIGLFMLIFGIPIHFGWNSGRRYRERGHRGHRGHHRR
jgi:hypothetical protein